MLLDWVSFLAFPNLFKIKGFVVVVVVRFITATHIPAISCEVHQWKVHTCEASCEHPNEGTEVGFWVVIDCLYFL
jgi:hypothetical protein